MSWRPCLRDDVDMFTLSLNAQQGFLVSRLDGSTDLGDLAVLTGLDLDQVQSLLQTLVGLGVVIPQKENGPSGPLHEEAPSKIESPEENSSIQKLDEEGETPTQEAKDESAPLPIEKFTHRQLFEERLHRLPEDERAALAQRAMEPELSALCYDPLPQVIHALLNNPRFGPLHARLVASQHRTTQGLEYLGSRHAFAHDPGVRQALLQNPILPLSLFRRLWASRRLQEHFLIAISREAPEQTRIQARELLRASFAQRGAEEKAELILKSEGRCLNFFAGLSLDGHTTQLLCRRTYVSTLLIQNLARWNATPPQLIAYLLRQETVRRNAQLRQLLERHPNAGSRE